MAIANLLASSSSKSSANNNSPCDVFVNHRGPDTKSSIATPLYSSLTPHSLRVFLDKEEMEKGDFITSQISAAIREASVHIPIFSPRYAESEWCLNELLLMLESMESRRSTVIPVFYGVKPADLRRPLGENGLYAEALRRLQLETKTTDSKTHQEKPRYDSDAIEKWRDALCKVSYISGFEYDAGAPEWKVTTTFIYGYDDWMDYEGAEEARKLMNVPAEIMRVIHAVHLLSFPRQLIHWAVLYACGSC